MKAFILLVTIVWGVSASAVPKELKESEILNLTQLHPTEISKRTQVALEDHLFQEAHGRSCGLSHFYIEGYQTTESILDYSLKSFSVITEVYGPIYLCKGYEYFLCSTTWVKNSTQRRLQSWNVSKTFCEDDPGAEIIHFTNSLAY